MAYDPTYPADDIYVKDLPAAIRQKGEDIRGATDATPVGVVLSFAGNVAPGGYLLCDGQAVSRETYSTLFSVIGITFGSGDGSTTFNVPDLRGEFIRGLDGGRGVDSGRVLGSAQGSANLSHAHTGSAASGGAHDHTASSSSSGSHEHSGSAASGGSHSHSFSAILSLNKATVASGGSYAAALYNVPQSGSTGSDGAHTHSLSISSNGTHSHSVTINSASTHTHSMSLNNSGGTEARPRNIALNHIIKA